VITNGQNYIALTPGQTLNAENGKAIVDGTLGGQHSMEETVPLSWSPDQTTL
jgi:hypothetical protein